MPEGRLAALERALEETYETADGIASRLVKLRDELGGYPDPAPAVYGMTYGGGGGGTGGATSDASDRSALRECENRAAMLGGRVARIEQVLKQLESVLR